MEIGFRPDALLRAHGWAPDRDWDRDAALSELSFWRRQGASVVEIASDLRSTDGPFFRFSDREWRELRAIFEASGLRPHSILAWRRMICREPWTGNALRELDRVMDLVEIFELKIVTIMVGFPWYASTEHPRPRRRFRSLTDATEGDFHLAAERLKAYCRRLANVGASLTLEMHDDTLHDCATAALRLRELIDEPNVGINPDTLDNRWLYPGLPIGDAVEQARQVAPFVNHWHVKQFQRVWSETAWVGGDWTLHESHVDAGDQPIAAIARVLWQAGFRGAAIQENGHGRDAPADLHRHVEYMRWLIDRYLPGA